MEPEERDAAYLFDMLEAARAVSNFCAGVGLPAYMEDAKLQAAVERKVEIIGEAARRISQSFKNAHPDIPWRTIIGLRNILAHDYGEIRQDRLWGLVTIHIPSLIARVEPLLPPEPRETAE